MFEVRPQDEALSLEVIRGSRRREDFKPPCPASCHNDSGFVCSSAAQGARHFVSDMRNCQLMSVVNVGCVRGDAVVSEDLDSVVAVNGGIRAPSPSPAAGSSL